MLPVATTMSWPIINIFNILEKARCCLLLQPCHDTLSNFAIYLKKPDVACCWGTRCFGYLTYTLKICMLPVAATKSWPIINIFNILEKARCCLLLRNPLFWNLDIHLQNMTVACCFNQWHIKKCHYMLNKAGCCLLLRNLSFCNFDINFENLPVAFCCKQWHI